MPIIIQLHAIAMFTFPFIKISAPKIASLILILEVSKIAFSQYSIDPKIRASSILVQSNSGSGSGFILNDTLTKHLFIVTARHVIMNIQQTEVVDSITITCYREDVDADSKSVFKIGLTDCANSGNLQIDNKNDVAVIEFGKLVPMGEYASIRYSNYVKKLSKETKIEAWPSFLSMPLEKVIPGSDLFIIGFPQSLGLQGNFDADRPLMRKGIIAGKDLKLGRIIGDGAVYFGNSGGIAVAIHYENNDFKTVLVGLISQYIPFDESLYDKRGMQRSIDFRNSGYSVIIPVNYILPLLSKCNLH